ncbi:MAG: hypothetical protein NZ571_14730 [Anaerolineae bacterium]|nr:hypothetical protein [Anaerolineae bacterium]
MPKKQTITFNVVLLSLVIVAVFTPVAYGFYRLYPGDFIGHQDFAEGMEKNGEVKRPHVLYHVIFTMLRNCMGNQGIEGVFLLMATFLYVMIGIGLFLSLSLHAPAAIMKISLLSIVVLLLVSKPIYIWFNLPQFIGYINYVSHHNPTQILLTVFVVPVSLIALRAISPQPYRNLNQRIFLISFSALIVLLLSVSKPSYSIALLPALGLVVLYRLLRRLPIDWTLLIISIIFPSLTLLSVQYVTAYIAEQETAIGIGQLEFFRVHRLQAWEVFVRLTLSILFPAVVYRLYISEALKNDYLNLAWLTFGVSLAWSYLLHEQGNRLGDGNFVWSSYVSLFVLMFSTVLFLLKQHAAESFRLSCRFVVSGVAFLLHVGSGVYTAVRVIAGL